MKSTYGLPASHVHAINHNIAPAASAAKHCNNSNSTAWPHNWPLCPKNLPCTHSFYAQWEKASVCYGRVKEIETQPSFGSKFNFVIKMRVDWPFVTGPSLISLADPRIVYARFRCVSTKPFFIPSLYIAYNVHVGSRPLAWHGNCLWNAIFSDDQLVIAPRQIADKVFSCVDLDCPYESDDLKERVARVCRNLAWPECFMQLHWERQQLQVGPIPVEWRAISAAEIRARKCIGSDCSLNPRSKRRHHSKALRKHGSSPITNSTLTTL